MVRFVIVPIQCFLPDSEGSFDGQRIVGIKGRCGEMLVDVIHSGYHSGDVWCTTQEKEGRILENLSGQPVLIS